MPRCLLSWNPIATYEAVSSESTLAYCPFGYGYSNYARCGYSQHRLEFSDLIRCPGGGKWRSTLGGTGLAISAPCRHKEKAAEYVHFVASAECQRTLYFDSGGQPGHRLAWLDPRINEVTQGFFLNTLETLDRAFVRPRYQGYLYFQDHAGAASLSRRTASRALVLGLGPLRGWP